MSKPTIVAVIITKNEEKMIANCIGTLHWCDRVIVIDNGSDDRTAAIAAQLRAEVYQHQGVSFADIRNFGLEKAKNFDWIFYVDADERVTPNLAKEILVQTETATADALKLNRSNMMFGTYFAHGGWQNDQQTRVFRVKNFPGWTGEIHESATVSGAPLLLHQPLLHFTHRNTIDGLKKTVAWTPIEAKLLYEAGAPSVTMVTLMRKGVMEIFRRAILKGGYQDGMPGWVESVTQGLNRVLVYLQLWELQQQPTLEEKYQAQEKELLQLWKKEK